MKTFDVKEFCNEFETLVLNSEYFKSAIILDASHFDVTLQSGEEVIFDLSDIVKINEVGEYEFSGTRQLCVRYNGEYKAMLNNTFDFLSSGGIWIISHYQHKGNESFYGLKLPCIIVQNVRDFLDITLNELNLRNRLIEDKKTGSKSVVYFCDDTYNPADYDWDEDDED